MTVDFAAFAKQCIQINAHASMRIEAAAVNGEPRIIYVDPFLVDDGHGVPVPPHDADIICFTHSHYDHFSPSDAAEVAREDGFTRCVMPSCMCTDAVAAGMPENAILSVEPGEVAYILGVPVAAVPAYNIGKTFHPKENGWVGYMIQAQPSVCVYVCGDTDVTPELKSVPCDIICIPVGGKYTMDAPEAAACVNELFAGNGRPAVAIPIHYGSVTGTAEDGKTFAGLVNEGVTVLVPY